MLNNDIAIVEFRGEILEKEEKENRTKITIQVDNMKFFLSAWEDNRKLLEDFNIGNFVGLKCKITNNDYEKDGEKVYSFNFSILDAYYVSSKPLANVEIIGRMTRDMEVRHFEVIDEDFVVGTLAVNGSKNTTFISFLHRDFNENIGILLGKGERVHAKGCLKHSVNGYTFYVNEIAACPIKKEKENS